MARFTSVLWQSCDFQKIQLIQKEDLLEQKYFTGHMPLITSNHSFNTYGAAEILTSVTFIKKCGGKLAQESMNATHLELPHLADIKLTPVIEDMIK